MVFVWAVVGLALLVGAGDALVRGAVNLALRLGIPALIVSLTIVAFGTSAPELLISIQAVLDGVPGIALGNVVGSNTANVLLVLGVPALLTGLTMHGDETRKSFLTMIGATLLFIGLCFATPLTWWHGLVMLGALALVLGDQFREARTARRDKKAAALLEDEVEGADLSMPWWKIIVFLIVGLVGLPIGAQLLINASTQIAKIFGLSDAVIGLTLVAIGTSLPELATTIAAAFRRQADVALGNVIGSNLFNLLAIIGIAALVGPIPVAREFLVLDLWVMLAASLLLAPFVFRNWYMGRIWGALFCATYAAYLARLVMS
ncbi:calcium/sodium antiporter [Maribius pontilimi]|uniref:Calcium/sodium antiporter n=1 Tax=Palleronia pontilimi TaxID=1964209 RepID=A0A934IEH7_9RHOB|nr:calcium/sodium antiporter [Palleronia pontilimi]MBJ3761682.1 calcium/sodium antiporter [Palleronia pontilimi]